MNAIMEMFYAIDFVDDTSFFILLLFFLVVIFCAAIAMVP